MNVSECVCTCLSIVNEVYSDCTCTCENDEYNEAKYIAKEVFGYITSVLVTVKMLPQVIKSYKTKQFGHLSMKFLIIGVFGAISAFIFGCLFEKGFELSIVIRAAITFTLTWLLIGSKLYYNKKNKEQEQIEGSEVEMTELTKDTDDLTEVEIDSKVNENSETDSIMEVNENSEEDV